MRILITRPIWSPYAQTRLRAHGIAPFVIPDMSTPRLYKTNQTRVSVALFIPHHSSFTANMEQTTASQPFVPLFDTLPSSRTSAASIWAPQPQPSDTAWTKAIDSFTRANYSGPASTTRPPHRPSSFPVPNGEDVFGPLGLDGQRRRDVGAIGDGRKKLSPTFDELVSRTHVSYMRIYGLTIST